MFRLVLSRTISISPAKSLKISFSYPPTRVKIQKLQQPFYRILELALLNKETILQEKQYQIKQHTHEQASTTQRTEEHKQNTTDTTDMENIFHLI